jgi:prevent-host-death family protein
VKAISVRDLQRRVKGCVDDAQRERVIITRRGQPAAVLVGVEGQDWEAVVWGTDPTFWRLIRARRREATVSFGAMRRRVLPAREVRALRAATPANRSRGR